MKQTSIYTAALATALMLIPAACSDEQYGNDRTPGQQPGASGPLITVIATQGDRPQTRLGYVDPNDPAKPIEVTWATGDKFYVGKDWPAFSDELFLSEMTEYFSPFTLKEGGAGSKNAEFEGNAPTGMKNGDKLYAIYGDGEARIVPSMQEPGTLLFDYRYPEQTANDDQSHLSATDFMIASTTYTTGQQPVFAFTHLGAMMKFTLTLPTEGLEVKQLKLTTTDKSEPFIETAQWNKDGALAFSNGNSNSKQLLLSLGEINGPGITLTGTKVLTAYMMVAPTTLTKDTAPIAGKELKLEVTDADGVVYTANLKGADIVQGNYYTVQAALGQLFNEMKFDIKVESGSLDFRIPFPTSVNTPAGIDITVDWGDGKEVTTVSGGTPLTSTDGFKYTYTDAGTYTITITSSQIDATKQQIPSFNFNDNSDANKLISMNTPMLNTGEANFANCFKGCTSLTSLPPGLFDKNTKVTNFSDCFDNCTSLTSLPPGLFDKNTKVTKFSYCFDGCSGLTSLPPGLFDKNTNVTNFSYCFRKCSSLTELPTGLFDKNTKVTNFSICFDGCSGLTSLPPGLFDKNTSVKDFSYCFQSTSLASLPQGLFEKNINATDFSSCFNYCTKLVLNETIFSAATPDAKKTRFSGKTMNFSSCFGSTGSALTPEQQAGSVAPQLWSYENSTATWTTTDCYKNCKAGNLAGIPTGWGTPAN